MTHGGSSLGLFRSAPVAAIVVGGIRQNGAHQRAARCPQDHVQRREAWQASSADQTLLEGRYQVLAGHDEAR